VSKSKKEKELHPPANILKRCKQKVLGLKASVFIQRQVKLDYGIRRFTRDIIKKGI